MENVDGEMSIRMAGDLVVVTYLYWNEETYETKAIYNFYTLDGELIREVNPQEFGDDAVMTLVDQSLLIYADDEIRIYDPVSGETTEEIEFTDTIITYFYSMDEEYIYAQGYDTNNYKISRADGSSRKY